MNFALRIIHKYAVVIYCIGAAAIFTHCSTPLDETKLRNHSYRVLDSLLSDADIHAKTQIVSVLRTITTPESKEILHTLLSHPESSLQRESAFALAFQGDVSVSKKIIYYTQSPNWLIRKNATAFLKYLPPEDAISALEPLLDDSHQPIKLEAIEVLGELNVPAVLPHLQKASRGSLRAARSAAFNKLLFLHDNLGIPFIVEELNSDDVDRVQEVMIFISESRDTSFVPIIAPLAYHDNVDIRRLTANYLGGLKTEESEKILLHLMNDSDSDVKKKAILSSAQLRLNESIPSLIELLYESKGLIYWDALRIAVNWGVEPLRNTVTDMYEAENDQRTKAALGTILLHFGDNRAKSYLHEVVKNKTRLDLLDGIFNGFESVQSTRFIPLLLTIARDDSSVFRQRAIDILSHYDTDEVLDYFGNILEDSPTGVQRKAAAIIGKWVAESNKKAFKYLLRALEHSDPRIREISSYHAGYASLSAALEPLANLLNDADESVKIASAWAILKILDKPVLE